MKIRGERECQECGTQWSYYETGSVVCPSCGSLRSVGLDDRTEHTASAVSLELSPVRELVDEQPLAEVADEAAAVCREYVRKSGFVKGGDLQPLDDTYLAAAELAQAGAEVAHSLRLSDDEEYYFFSLLRGADAGDRPPADDVPTSMRSVRGLAYARAVEDYRADLRRYLDENPDPTAQRLLSTLRDQQKRIEALDGDVSPRAAGELVYVVRAIARALLDDDETALTEARRRLDEFDIDF